MHRGEVWWATLPEPVGSIPGYRRPLVIVQADSFNRSRINTVIAVVLSSNLKLVDAPGNVLLSMQNTGLPKDSVANTSQLVTVDKQLLTEQVGQLSARQMQRLEEGMRLVLSL